MWIPNKVLQNVIAAFSTSSVGETIVVIFVNNSHQLLHEISFLCVMHICVVPSVLTERQYFSSHASTPPPIDPNQCTAPRTEERDAGATELSPRWLSEKAFSDDNLSVHLPMIWFSWRCCSTERRAMISLNTQQMCVFTHTCVWECRCECVFEVSVYICNSYSSRECRKMAMLEWKEGNGREPSRGKRDNMSES